MDPDSPPPRASFHENIPLRVLAFALGVSVAIGGLFFAAEVGEVLVGAPIIFLGGLGIAAGLTGTVPRPFRR